MRERSKPSEVLVLFTGEGRKRIASAGSSAHWRLDAARAKRCRYAICVRNARSTLFGPGEGAAEPHGAAFCVGEIDRLEPAAYGDQERTRVVFSSLADVSVPNFWEGHQNPVRYMPYVAVAAHGIVIERLPFRSIDGMDRPAGP